MNFKARPGDFQHAFVTHHGMELDPKFQKFLIPGGDHATPLGENIDGCIMGILEFLKNQNRKHLF